MLEALNEVMETTNIPKLLHADYGDAVRAYEEKITFGTLVRLGFEVEDASYWSRKSRGCARSRVIKILKIFDEL